MKKPSARMNSFITMHAAKAYRELLHHCAGPSEARCEHDECTAGGPFYRCMACFRAPNLCKKHMVETHLNQPLHTIEKWDESIGSWSRGLVASLGRPSKVAGDCGKSEPIPGEFVLYLGHGGQPCVYNIRSKLETVIVHVHGIDTIRIGYCGCPENPANKDHATQLLQFKLWPASWTTPETVFTFAVMAEFRLLSVIAHTNAYDYWRYLTELTDDVFPDECPVSYCLVSTEVCAE